MSPLRIAFFGTPEFAVPTLRALVASRHAVACVVSQPDRPRGRGRRESPSPVSELALAEGVPLLRPERVGDADVEAALRAHAPDLGVVVAFGQFVPKRIRELPRLGYCINGHASLLPRLRGAAPIARAILADDSETGISVMRVEREMDAGAVALQRAIPIGPDETAGELEARLAALCAECIAAALDAIEAGTIAWSEQDASLATLAPKIEKADAALDFARPARELALRVRALAPAPGAVAALGGEALRILAARAEAGPVDREPGVVSRRGSALRIATADGWLVPTALQRAGGKRLATADFLRGREIRDGERLDAPSAAPSSRPTAPRS
jgi:methionyl-tRNA formyltransferase